MMNATSWDRMLNGSQASQASGDEVVKIYARATVTFACGSVAPRILMKERGSFCVWTPDYCERFTSKRAALAAYPELVNPVHPSIYAFPF